MGIRDIFGKGKKNSSNAEKAALAVQRLKTEGTVERLSKSQIVYLITNLPDAKKHLNERQYQFVESVFDRYRKETELISMDMYKYVAVCREIITAYETSVPYFLFDGGYSERLSGKDVEDVWLLYDEGFRFEKMAELVSINEVGRRASEIRACKNRGGQVDTVTVFHIARNMDGSVQPIVAAPVCATDIPLLKLLLKTNDLGVHEVSHYNKDFYYFLFDNNASKPYPSVMILKFIQTAGGKKYIDMGQEDMKAVTYAIENYLS